MKYLNLLILSLVLLIGGCKDSAKPKLIMVTNAEFPPYEFMDGQRIDGIDPAIIRTVAERLNYDLEIQNMNFDSVIAAVQSGKADIAASGLTITEERKKQVSFTIPYVIAQQLVLVRKNSKIKDLSQLRTLRIGVQHGTTGDLYVSQKIKEPERFTSGPVAVAALAAGKLDAVVIDSEPASVFASQRPDLKIMPEPLTFEEYAFAVNKKNRKLLAGINAELIKMQQSGELDAIIQSYKEKNKPAESTLSEENKALFMGLKEMFYLNFVKDKRYMYLLNGFWVTLKITFFSTILGIVIGYAVAIIRCTATQTGKMKISNFLCKVYLTVIRGTPAVVQLLIIYFVIFGSMDVDKELVAVLAFGINSGAYVAEIIRSGIMSIDKGQMEAGRSLGLSYAQTMHLVIIPQAFKNVLPALGNEFIVLLKETSVAGYIALHDLTKGGDIIRSQTYDAFFPLIAVALIYLAMVMLLSKLLGNLEKRLKKNE